MKIFIKRIIAIIMIVCTILPIIASWQVLADSDAVILTQERAGNYAASFAINFFNNWSSSNHSFEDETGDPVRTAYVSSTSSLPNPDDSTYYFSKTSWIDFVYANALSLVGTQLPRSNYGENGAYEQIIVADLEEQIDKIKEHNETIVEPEENEETEQEETEENENDSQKRKKIETTLELMNSGKIKTGDILITSEDDYLLYVGGLKVIYVVAPDDVHPTDTGALKYDYIQTYFVEVNRHLMKGHEDEEDYKPEYGLKEIYRISQNSLNTWNGGITDAKVNLMFNDRGYYDKDNKYEGLPKGRYEGSTHKGISLLGLIKGLFEIFKFLVNLALYLVRASIVGWVNIVESLVQGTILKLSGYSFFSGIADRMTGVNATSYSGNRITIESFLFNKVPLTDANFFNFETAGGYELLKDGKPVTWIYSIRQYMAGVYVTLRNISIAAMLFVLMYIAIRMALSSIAQRKAQFKKMLTSWFTGLCIVLFIHLFMYLVFFVNDNVVEILLDQNTAVAEQIIGEGTETLTLYDAIRTKAYSWDFYDGLAGLIMYIVMVYFLIRYVFIYLKRMISVYVLAIYGSVIGVKYAIDKSSGKKSSASLGKWIKDFMFNVLLQSIHCLIYVVLMSVAVEMAMESAGGIIVAILICQFILKADGIFMKIFDIKGSLLDDTNKAPKVQGMFKTATSAFKTGAMAYGIFKFGKGLFGEKTGIRPALRYALNYREGDTDEQTIARGESKLLDFKAKWRMKMLENVHTHNHDIPIKALAERRKANVDLQEKRRNLYNAMLQTNNYEVKRAIYNSIEAEKKIRGERFKRTLGVGGKLAGGTFGLVATPGIMTEGFEPGIAAAIAATSTLSAKSRKNVNLYRRTNPDKHISPGIIGEAQIKNEKSEKDMKKLRDKQESLTRIAVLQGQLDKKVAELSEETGMSKDDIYKKLQGAIKASQKASISGTKIKNSVNNYSAGHNGKLNESDIDGVLVELQRELNEAKSDIVIDDTMAERIKQSVRNSGKNINNVDGKEFAKILAEAIQQPDVISVVPGGKVMDVADSMGIDKLANKIIREYENRIGTNLTDDQKKDLKRKMKDLSGLENMTESDIVKNVMDSMDGIGLDETKLKEATESAAANGIPKIGDKDFHSMMKKIEMKIKAKGIDVDLTKENGSNTDLSQIEKEVKQKVIDKQKAKIAGDPTKASEMSKLNSGQIIPEESNADLAQMIYEALSEPGAVPIVSAPDSKVQKLLQDSSELLRKINGINQANIAKNKESAVSYGKIVHEILENF